MSATLPSIRSVVCLGLACAWGCGRPAVKTPEAPKDLVHFVGRFDRSDPAGPRFAWPGSAIHTRFVGTEISVNLVDTENQYQVVVDGEPKSVLKANAHTRRYLVATGLSDGEHDVVLYRRTEALFNPSQFLGFDVKAPGRLIEAVHTPARTMEIIGDSISCGYGNEGDRATCPFSADTENAYLTYGAIAARELHAEHTIIAWSGKGMYRNYNGNEAAEPFPIIYERTLPTEANSLWSFSGPTPDVVMINLGTNDFSLGDPGPPFLDEYAKFLTRLRTRYPSAIVFAGVGPLDIKKQYAAMHEAVGRVVAEARGRGDTRIHEVQFEIQNAELDGVGCDNHPSVATHRRMAKVLVEAVREKTGWR